MDGGTFEEAAIREAYEECGLTINRLTLVHRRVYTNPCKRHINSWHSWKVFEVEAGEWSGELRPGSDAGAARWVPVDRLNALAKTTIKVMQRVGVSEGDLLSTRAVADDLAWQDSPGLEPIWMIILRDLGILDLSDVE